MTRKQTITVYKWTAALIFALMLLPFTIPDANATTRYDVEAEAEAVATVDASALAESMSVSDAVAASSNEGNELSVNSTYESGPADLVLVPNNNTERCLRVFGIAFGNDSTSTVLGIPWRSDACDFEGAADDAFAQGLQGIGWYWKCHNSSLYKTFKDKGMAKDVAIGLCHTRMVGDITAQDTIRKLRDQLAFVENERRIERTKCDQSKDRITEACYGGK